MKKLLFISVLFLIGIIPNAFAQNKIGDLQGIYYQAVAVDDIGKEIVGTDITGKPVYNKAIGVRFTITKGLNGTIQWEETHTTNTDKYGMFTLVIGKGTKTGASTIARMLDIPWIDADQFLKVEIAIKNDGNYKLVSNQQFMSVPYSFYTDDIADSAITTYKIKDSAILNQDINTSAVDSRTILDSTIINRDIRSSAVDSRTILDSTIINQDIRSGAVDSRTILDSTLINQDIRSGAVDSRTILDSTIINQDIRSGAVDSRTILNGTLINEDIADSTIDLTSKVTGVLPITNGGTGTTSFIPNSFLVVDSTGAIQTIDSATNGQILVGVTDSLPKLKLLTGTGGISVTYTADSVIISSRISGVFNAVGVNLDPGEVDFLSTWVSPPIELLGVNFGDIIVGSLAVDLQGIMMTTYVSAPNTIRVALYNGTGDNIDLGTGLVLNVGIMQR